MTSELNPDRSRSAKFTHVCIDCGALGIAGGYHDHGGGNAGDTIPLSSLPLAVRSFQAIEQERDELRAENGRLREDFENALSALKVIGRPGENYGLSDRLARSVALAAYVDLSPETDDSRLSEENDRG